MSTFSGVRIQDIHYTPQVKPTELATHESSFLVGNVHIKRCVDLIFAICRSGGHSFDKH